jgi:ACR3 family arsenite efflux pump ArsB
MFLIDFFFTKAMVGTYDKTASVAFTATGNNFEIQKLLQLGFSYRTLGKPLQALGVH